MTQREIKICGTVIKKFLRDENSFLSDFLKQLTFVKHNSLTQAEQNRLNRHHANRYLNLLTQPLCTLFFVSHNSFDKDIEVQLETFLQRQFLEVYKGLWYEYA